MNSAGPQILALNLAVDALAVEVSRRLDDQEIDHILLKGPSIERWLYHRGERVYGDVDVLVRPVDISSAQAALLAAGFAQTSPGPPFLEAPHALPWKRRGTPGAIDLHTRIPGCTGPAELQADVLFSLTEPLEVGGKAIPVLAPVARALHVVLHAAQHGVRVAKPVADLERLLDAHQEAGFWSKVRELAAAVEADQAFAAGLLRTDSGSALYERLDLRPPSNVATVLRATKRDVGPSLGLERLAAAVGTRARIEILKAAIWPDASFMRSRYALARRGGAGLLVMRALRLPVLLLRALGRGFPTWFRVRRSLKRGSAGSPDDRSDA